MCYQCSSTKKPVLGEVWHCCCDWFCLQLSFQVWAMSHLLRITWSLSLPAAKECNPPFQSLEEKRFFQPRSGHCVKEDLAAFLVPWNLPNRRRTGAWSDPNLAPWLLQRTGSVEGFGVEHDSSTSKLKGNVCGNVLQLPMIFRGRNERWNTLLEHASLEVLLWTIVLATLRGEKGNFWNQSILLSYRTMLNTGKKHFADLTLRKLLLLDLKWWT